MDIARFKYANYASRRRITMTSKDDKNAIAAYRTSAVRPFETNDLVSSPKQVSPRAVDGHILSIDPYVACDLCHVHGLGRPHCHKEGEKPHVHKEKAR